MSKQALIDEITAISITAAHVDHAEVDLELMVKIINKHLEGMVIVPEESTVEMDDAGDNEIENHGSAENAYYAMLKAYEEQS